MVPRIRSRALLIAFVASAFPTLAADIVLTPPASGGVSVTNAAGNSTRLRVADDGSITLPGLGAVPVPSTGLCVEIATGKVGTCSQGSGGTVTSVATGAGLTGGPITGSGTISADTSVLQARVSGTCAAGSSIRVIATDGSVTCQADGPANAFVQGGNAFGAAATLGTTDNQAVNIVANNLATLRITPNATSPNLLAGHSANSITAGAAGAVVAGGGASGTIAPIGGASCGASCANRVTDSGGTVGGGTANQAGDAAGTTSDRIYATVAGGLRNEAGGTLSTVGGGQGNTASGARSFVGGGLANLASAVDSTVSGGSGNAAINSYSTVGGGRTNEASGSDSTVGGGLGNTAVAANATVGGGGLNSASGTSSTVGGGVGNAAGGQASTISGGASNTASGDFSTVAGGSSNVASGHFSFAAGRGARTQTSGGTIHDSVFIWADNSAGLSFYSTAANEFSARATGGVRFVTAVDGVGTPTAGVTLAAGGGAWAALSDVNAKADFAAVDARLVLEKVAALPIRSWRYKSQEASIRHIGPTAQDFRAAFAVGESERTITTVDADGVALAAIQGLHQLVAEKERRIAELEEKMERLLKALAGERR